jgi:hypothetical protein
MGQPGVLAIMVGAGLIGVIKCAEIRVQYLVKRVSLEKRYFLTTPYTHASDVALFDGMTDAERLAFLGGLDDGAVKPPVEPFKPLIREMEGFSIITVGDSKTEPKGRLIWMNYCWHILGAPLSKTALSR